MSDCVCFQVAKSHELGKVEINPPSHRSEAELSFVGKERDRTGEKFVCQSSKPLPNI